MMNTTLKKRNWKKWSLLLGATLMVGTAGCADRNNDNIPESPATQGEIEQTAETVGDAATNAANTARSEAKHLDDAAVITPKVKTALGGNASLEGSSIDVDTNNEAVTLNGTVKNAAQKNVAGNIAKQNAPGYKIVNNLKVTGGASPVKNP